MPDPADMTRAEGAIVEAWERIIQERDLRHCQFTAPTLSSEAFARLLLAAARHVAIEVTCETCWGTGVDPEWLCGCGRGVRHVVDCGTRPTAQRAPCPDCQDGTRTVNALGLLAGEDQ